MNPFRIIKTVAVIGGLSLLPVCSSPVSAGTLDTPEYWQSVQTQNRQPLLAAAQVQQKNETLRQRASSLRELKEYPAVLTSQQVQQRVYAAMQDYWHGDRPAIYMDGQVLTDATWAAVRENCNLNALPVEVQTRYAVTTARGNLRLLPTDSTWTKSIGSSFDRLQGTAIDPAQPVVVLADSQDGQFLYVESTDYQGWLDRDKLAFTDRQLWLDYVAPKDFAVVTDHKKTITDAKGNQALYQMGAVIPCIIDQNGRMALKLASRGTDGSLAISLMPTQFDRSLHIGYLPFNNETIIQQAFRFLGDSYDWGGMNDSVDCSAFVQDVYRSMGIHIPRDADQQEVAMPVQTTDITKAQLGALVFKPGHVMMYLGQDPTGTPMVIHASSAYQQVMVARLYDVTSTISSVGSIR